MMMPVPKPKPSSSLLCEPFFFDFGLERVEEDLLLLEILG